MAPFPLDFTSQGKSNRRSEDDEESSFSPIESYFVISVGIILLISDLDSVSRFSSSSILLKIAGGLFTLMKIEYHGIIFVVFYKKKKINVTCILIILMIRRRRVRWSTVRSPRYTVHY